MITDKQSFILCAFITFGFSLSGMIQILDNFVIIAVLSLGFILVVVNLFLKKDNFFQEDNPENESDTKKD